jgi:hypothetical protein
MPCSSQKSVNGMPFLSFSEDLVPLSVVAVVVFAFCEATEQ